MPLSRHPYATHAYAAALASAGPMRPIDVPEWSTFVTVRPIGGGGEDAAGPYPRTPLGPRADIAGGVRRLAEEHLVSVVLVSDPLSNPDPTRLAGAFDRCLPFKTHHVIDRGKGPFAPSKHHRQEIRRARARCAIERVDLAANLEVWASLYGALVERRSVKGVAAFSPAYFQALAADPVYAAFAAIADGEVLAMAIWFEHDGVAYNHLGASNEAGYAVGASYALYDAAIAHFRGAALIDLGAGAGLADDPDDGLARFKRGFANGQATAFLCGAILDQTRYARLAAGGATDFFPAYRG